MMTATTGTSTGAATHSIETSTHLDMMNYSTPVWTGVSGLLSTIADMDSTGVMTTADNRGLTGDTSVSSIPTATTFSESLQTNLTTLPSTAATITTTEHNLIVDVSSTAEIVIAVYIGLLCFFGIFNNAVVLVLYWWCKSLQKPVNLFLVNISLSDLTVSLFGSTFMFTSTLKGEWLFGSGGCTWYAFITTLAGKCVGVFSRGKPLL